MVSGMDTIAYLRLFRLPSMFTAIADSAAGYLLFHAPSYEPWVLPLLAITSAGLHCFGSGLKDLADLKRGRLTGPDEILTSGRLTLRQARWAVILALAASFEGMMWLGTTGFGEQVVLAWVVALLCIYVYSAGRARLSPIVGLIRAANLMIGVCVGTGIGYSSMVDNPVMLLPLTIPAFIYATALATLHPLEREDIQRSRLWIGVGAMVVAAGLSTSLHPPSQPDWYDYESSLISWTRGVFNPGIFFGGRVAAGVLSAWLCWRAWAIRDRTRTVCFVRDGIAGFIVLDSSLLMSNGRDGESGLLIAGLLIPVLFSRWMFKRLA